MKNRVLFIVSAMVFCVAMGHAQDSPDDALKLLQQVAAHNRDAQYIHLEANETNTTHSARRDTSETASYSVTLAPGGRYRYTGEDSVGSFVLVSDGTQEWHLLNGFKEYAKAPVGSWKYEVRSVAGDDRSLIEASHLGWLTSLDVGLRSAQFLPDEVLNENGKSVRCTVVRVGSSDSTQRQISDADWTKTYWIDRPSLRVLKIDTVQHSRPLYGKGAEPYGPEMTQNSVTIFTIANLNFEPHGDTFTFHPPADSREVAKLPSSLLGPPPPGRDVQKNADATHLGKPLPEITLKDAVGADVSFSRYKGHPLLIDVWATWCGPCISEMPALAHIRKSTASTDLQIVGVDQDLHSTDAAALLKERGYDWPDFAYTPQFVKAISLNGIPLLVLVNADGNIVYYHSGADDAKGLAEAIAKLGPAYTGVRID